MIRNKVKTFAQGAIGKSNTKMPPFKLIILDEADSMTNDAQSALRRMIENYSKVTRFCLICMPFESDFPSIRAAYFQKNCCSWVGPFGPHS